ncbi:DUF3570 domain-containing protein [Flavobacterium silvisoli]|uniref:DUF3570 domain-containing protein n=1 Tax=Flavobacterium silvisoli TaxID=2529433 RepID=A0A4Q9Z2L1_9FLAO|nr:DUF3570 domain-containing protein [Flavobacterium silvisoli]TBX70360.1 DUF3570 domain-containing protein [Flavobacterium silvisoli]
MKKRVISVAVLAFLFSVQGKAQNDTVSGNYKKQKLKLEEINFISSYYSQDGNNSAVTGGVGTEKLTDIATNIEVILSKKNQKNNVHGFDLSLGIDSYTSASSDKIDPSTVSSASYQDVRVYPAANYTFTNTEQKYALNAGVSFSAEFDYTSIGTNIGFTKTSKDNNREFSVKAMAFFDTWKVILPIELRNNPSDDEAKHLDTKPRNSYNLGFTLSQVINKNFQLALLADLGYQDGLLATKFNRVYFEDASVRSEKLPSNRFKIPVGIRANYYMTDRIILRTFYRYYYDNWDISAHTFSIEPSIKLTPFASLSLPYRFYTQNAAKYFRPIYQHELTDSYYTSDYDLSKFTSNMIGLGYHLTDSNKGIFNVKRIHSLELRYGYYTRNNGLSSHIITLALQFK